MNFEQLQRFLVVAECLNFTTAAERLYVGQSTISRQIAALEQELGVVLLIRGPRSVELTAAGEVLQLEGKKLMQHLQSVKNKVVATGQGTSGKIRIATLPARFPWLNTICLNTMTAYPDLKCDLFYSPYVNTCQDLDVGSADVAVSYSFLNPHSDAYEVIALEESRFYVLCRKDHWIAQREGIYLDELRDTDICFGRSGLLLTHQSQSYHGEPPSQESPTASSIEGNLLLLQCSDSVMILPGASIDGLNHNLAQVPLLDDDLKHFTTLVYRKDSVNNTVSHFLKIVQEYIGSQQF